MSSKNSADWVLNRVHYIKELKQPTDQQKLLVALYQKTDKTPDDEKKLGLLIKAEKALEKVQQAKTELNKLLQIEKQALRKQRDHELYQVAGLLIKAGLVDSQTGKPKMDKGELLGALVGLANVPSDHAKRVEWKQIGEALLKQ